MALPSAFPWIRPVLCCPLTHTVAQALAILHEYQDERLVLVTAQNHAVATVQLRDLLQGIVCRDITHQQTLDQVPQLRSLTLKMILNANPPDWKQWLHEGYHYPDEDYGFITEQGEFLGLLDYGVLLGFLLGTRPDCLVDPSSSGPTQPPALELAPPLPDSPPRVPGSQDPHPLLGYLGHELKTPLTALLGLSTLLKEEALGSLTDRQRHYSYLIYQGVRDLIELVNGVLDLSRLQTGQETLSLEILSLESLVNEAWSLALNQLALRSSSNVDPNYPPAQPRLIPRLNPNLDMIWGDRHYTRRLFTALFLFGLDLQGDQGSLILDLRPSSSQGLTLILTLIPPGAPSPDPALTPETLDPDLDISTDLILSPDAPPHLTFWMAQGLAQSHGGHLQYKGDRLHLWLPQPITTNPITSRRPPPPSSPAQATPPCLLVYLGSVDPNSPGSSPNTAPLLNLDLLLPHTQILEAHDLDQAELLADIWTPHLLIISPQTWDNLPTLLRSISASTTLQRLPLLTLDEPTYLAATAIPGLQVFYLNLVPNPTENPASDRVTLADLWTHIQAILATLQSTPSV